MPNITSLQKPSMSELFPTPQQSNCQRGHTSHSAHKHTHLHTRDYLLLDLVHGLGHNAARGAVISVELVDGRVQPAHHQGPRLSAVHVREYAASDLRQEDEEDDGNVLHEGRPGGWSLARHCLGLGLGAHGGTLQLTRMSRTRLNFFSQAAPKIPRSATTTMPAPTAMRRYGPTKKMLFCTACTMTWSATSSHAPTPKRAKPQSCEGEGDARKSDSQQTSNVDPSRAAYQEETLQSNECELETQVGFAALPHCAQLSIALVLVDRERD